MMSIHVLLALTQIAWTSIVECPHLAGRYVTPGEDGAAYIAIAQRRCEAMRIVWLNRTYDGSQRSVQRFTLDGRFRLDRNQSGARIVQQTAGRFIGDTLELATKPGVAPDAAAVSRRRLFWRLANGDLCAVYIDSSGTRTGLVAGRITSSESEAADRADAANRDTASSCR